MNKTVSTSHRPFCLQFSQFEIAIPLPLTLLVALLFSGFSPRIGHAEDVGIRAPEGFEVSLYAGDDLAHDIYSMTIDSHGRVVVAGAGYVKTLHDDDGDGRADRATPFSEYPKSGAHGLLFDGDTLYATGDNAVLKMVDRDGDGKSDGPPERWVDGLTHKEHGANGIERGPDGYIYVICGNDAGVTEKFASTPDSPVTKPNCGAILRISTDGRESEILAHGFRNPYDLCFHPYGNIFTVDADGERDHHLPWYAPNRLFDVAIGMHHGWVLNGWQWSWNRPASYFDNVERCAEIGRGSPTGMLCYRHIQFPQKYRGGIFSACWTLGRIYHYPLTPRGSTFDGKVETFLETTGEVGFAPVDMAVGPQGDMFVAIGGRRTRGSVFRVRYKEQGFRFDFSGPRYDPNDRINRILLAPQPLDAWSRKKWVAEAQELAKEDFEEAACDKILALSMRIRAVEILTDLFGGPSEATAKELLKSDVQLAARTVWSVGKTWEAEPAEKFLVGAAKSRGQVARVAWEELASRKPPEQSEKLLPPWHYSGERLNRTAYYLARAKGRQIASNPASEELSNPSFPTDRLIMQALQNATNTSSDAERIKDFWWLDKNFKTFVEFHSASLLRLRLMTICLGDLDVDPSRKDSLPGYSLAQPAILSQLFGQIDEQGRPIESQCVSSICQHFPFDNAEVNREAARLMAVLQSGNNRFMHNVAEQLTDKSSPVDDIHYLMCLSRIPKHRPPETVKQIAAGIARLDGKMKQRGWYPSRNWPDRVGETFATLVKYDPDLPQAVVDHEAFKSPSQAFLFTRLSPEHQAAAARKLLKSVKDIDDEDEARWSPEMVSLVANLPADEALPALREAWDDFALRDAILLHLAKSPEKADRERFFESLSSIQPNIVETAAETLQKLRIEPTDDEWLALMQGLRQACSAPPAKSARQVLIALAEAWSGEQFEIKEKNDNLLASYQPCFDWFAQEHPALSHKLNELSGDIASWKDRLSTVDWTTGDVARGKAAFEKRSCSKCHAGTSPLGPDLAGAAGRFSRDDLFAAILDPSKEVAPLYQATQIVTGSGKIYHGLVVYESPDGTLLTTGPDTTIRIAGDEILSMRKSRLSIMPTGLLANASDAELADLYAYLHTLRGKK